RHKFIGDVFCGTKPENARIPGYVSIFGLKYGEKQNDKCDDYFQTVPKPLCAPGDARYAYSNEFIRRENPGTNSQKIPGKQSEKNRIQIYMILSDKKPFCGRSKRVFLYICKYKKDMLFNLLF
ncbi:MAG: hypothetical protein LBJ01_10050, partial [Tannerella sp.]|nr:hypothetical protein [Tannerella sp.]